MDQNNPNQMQRSNDAFSNFFAEDSDQQQFHAYDPSFLSGNNSNFNDASWGLNASNYPNSSREQPAASTWQNANHLSTASAHGTINGQPSQYARSLSHSPAPFAQTAFGNYQAQQNFQYGQQPQYDPQLFNTSTPGQNFNTNFGGFGNGGQNLGTIAPHALQQQVRSPALNNNAISGTNYAQHAFGQQRYTSAPVGKPVDQNALASNIPKGADNGYYSTIGYDQLARATNSERMAPYLNIGRDLQDWPVNRTTTLPSYVPRRSKNELRKLAGNNAALLEKIGKKSLKKERLLSSAKPILQSDLPGNAAERIKYEGETSSSEESDDDDDSSYTSDEDLEGSPLPNKRPESLKEGIEYDTIKALWRPKRKAIGGNDIKKAITDFWEITKTIRDRWKIDSAAVTQAEEKKRVGGLPLLRSRVKDGRDMMEAAVKAALKHGHRSILELLGENAAFVFLCYQFLLDRFKADDPNSPLPRSMLELLSIFTTLNDETLEKTHLVKVLPRYAKKADAKTAYYAKQITKNAAAASKEKAAAPPAEKPTATAKSSTAASPPVKKSEPEPVAGVKRSASNAGEGAAQKKIATGNAKPNGAVLATRPMAAVKKPTAAADAPKAAPSAAPATKTKQVTAKPSSFFSSLQSAAKKPGTSIKTGTPAQASGARPSEKKPTPTPTGASGAPKPTFSFAETMASLSKPKEEKPSSTKPEDKLPPETAEQKAKRLRKEARRKLHVSFKLGEDLVQVRYFTHEPEEELGHDDSQIRDVKDMGGEGRMLKMHADQMDLDEDDDGEDVDQPLIDFKTPRPIDFSVIDEDERSRNYVKYGGKLEPESAERAAREQYEANTLVVFYVDEKDIPPNPRDPSNPETGEQTSNVKQFGAPEPKYFKRAEQRRAFKPQPAPAQQQMPPFVNFAMNQFMQHHQPQQGQPPAQSPDLNQLLASLQGLQQQPQTQSAPMMGFGAQAPAPAMTQPQAPLQQNGQNIDLGAILAAIGGGQPQNPGQAPQMAGFGGAPGAPSMGFPPQMQQPEMGGQMDGGDDDDKQNKRWRDQGDKNKFYKTKVCKYWEEGRCMKGDGCTYLHEKPPGS